MTNWKLKMNIKELFIDTNTDSLRDLLDFSTAVRNRIMEHTYEIKMLGAWGFEIEDIIVDLKGLDDMDLIDDQLEKLYDWADYYDIWLGP